MAISMGEARFDLNADELWQDVSFFDLLPKEELARLWGEQRFDPITHTVKPLLCGHPK